MKKNSGSTLIEVLIAMLVLSGGLLGLAGLQATGLKNNLSAYHRSQATQLAYDIADRMRANIADAGNFTTSTYFTLAATAATQQAGCLAVAGACTVAQMAQNDLFQWNTNITTLLPNANGTVGVAGSTYTITINWDDNRDGVRDNNDPQFAMRFQL